MGLFLRPLVLPGAAWPQSVEPALVFQENPTLHMALLCLTQSKTQRASGLVGPGSLRVPGEGKRGGGRDSIEGPEKETGRDQVPVS